jgi:hypothetical protein
MRRAGWAVTNGPAGRANVLRWTIARPADKTSNRDSQPSQAISTEPSASNASVASAQYRPTPPDECALCGHLADDEAELCGKCQSAQMRDQPEEEEYEDVDDGSW